MKSESLVTLKEALALAFAIERQTNGEVWASFSAYLYPDQDVRADLLLNGTSEACENVIAGVGDVKKWHSTSQNTTFVETYTKSGIKVSTNWQDRVEPVTVSAEDKAQAESVVQG